LHTANGKLVAWVMPLGTLAGRLSCGHAETDETNRRNGNLDGHVLNGRFENPATPQPFRSLQSSKRPKTPFQCRRKLAPHPWLRYEWVVKTVDFNEVKRQEAQSRMAAIRKAPRSPASAAAQQRRASLVGDGAKWHITNFKQIACAIAKWKQPWFICLCRKTGLAYWGRLSNE